MAVPSLEELSQMSFAKYFWLDHQTAMQNTANQTIQTYALNLQTYRKILEDEINGLFLPTRIKLYLQRGLEKLNELHLDAFQWVNAYSQSLKEKKFYLQLINNPNSGYYIDKFATNTWKFDDHVFVRKLTRDTNFSFFLRIRFSWEYCMEINAAVIPPHLEQTPGIKTWIHLQSRTHWVEEERGMLIGAGFYASFVHDEEQAVITFWRKLTMEDQKTQLSDVIAHSVHTILNLAQFSKKRTLQFLFTDVLTVDQKNRILQDDFVTGSSSILRSFLRPRNDARLIVDLLQNYPGVPAQVYYDILYRIIKAISDFGLSVYREVFKDVCSMCPPNFIFFEKILLILLKNAELDCASFVLRSAGREFVTKVLDSCFVSHGLDKYCKTHFKKCLILLLTDFECEEFKFREDALYWLNTFLMVDKDVVKEIECEIQKQLI